MKYFLYSRAEAKQEILQGQLIHRDWVEKLNKEEALARENLISIKDTLIDNLQNSLESLRAEKSKLQKKFSEYLKQIKNIFFF